MSDTFRIEALAIGDELLDGRVADNNSRCLAERLRLCGHRLSQVTVVPDDLAVIVERAQAIAARGTRLCVASGGLGPTSDDLTRAAFAALAGVPLLRDTQVAANIEARMRARGRPFTANQLQQADRPAIAELVPNQHGMAPGFRLLHAGCEFVSLPGVPEEFAGMLEDAVVPRLPAAAGFERRNLWVFGLIEAEVGARLEELRSRFGAVRFAYRLRFPETEVVLSAPVTEGEQLREAADQVALILTPHNYPSGVESLAAATLAMLQAKHATLAVAESCTGGLIADLLTDVPGSSEVFQLGVVAYHNSAKQDVLAVSETQLEQHGAVSEVVVAAMAEGVRARAGTTFGLAVSGIAGPGGGTPEKPVGTVWLAGVGPGWSETRVLRLPFDRQRNKRYSAYSALDLLRRHLSVGGNRV